MKGNGNKSKPGRPSPPDLFVFYKSKCDHVHYQRRIIQTGNNGQTGFNAYFCLDINLKSNQDEDIAEIEMKSYVCNVFYTVNDIALF